MIKKALFLLASLLPALLAPAQAQEERYPTRTIRIIVPFSAGALTDTLARLYAEELTKRLGQPVIVENKPGSGGIPATQAMLGVAADGYVFQMVSSSHSVNPTLFSKLPYDTLKDISGVALVASSPTVAVVNPALGVKTLPEFIALAKSKPGRLNYGSAGIGSSTHLVAEYLRKEAGIDIVHVPYKGVQEAVTEVMAGRIDIAFPPIALALPQMKAGRIVGIAQTGAQRSPLIPEIPTAQEAGLRGFDYSIWYALVAPAKTPRPIMERIAREVREISALPSTREKMLAQGLVPHVLVLDEFDRYIRAEVEKQGALVKASGAKAD
jgi:tripartite-type tricarboxylate transporter receptor subunit TctC